MAKKRGSISGIRVGNPQNKLVLFVRLNSGVKGGQQAEGVEGNQGSKQQPNMTNMIFIQDI